jgi:hypothetical protein
LIGDVQDQAGAVTRLNVAAVGVFRVHQVFLSVSVQGVRLIGLRIAKPASETPWPG